MQSIGPGYQAGHKSALQHELYNKPVKPGPTIFINFPGASRAFALRGCAVNLFRWVSWFVYMPISAILTATAFLTF
jgi:hypothetical protein